MNTSPSPDSATHAHATVAPEDRVPTAQKLGYGLGTFHDMWGHWLYPSLAFQVFNIFLGVSPALVSTALMLNRIFDAVSDPVFGWMSDNTRSRFGRRRPYLLIGGVLAGVGLPLLFAVRPGWSENQYFLFMLASSALYIPIMSSFNMAFQSLGSELTPDYHERTSVASFKKGVQLIPEVAMFFALQFTTLSWFLDPATGKPNILQGAQTYCLILGSVMVLAAIVMFLTVRERYYGNVAARQQTKISLKDTIWRTIQCRPFRLQLLMALAYAIGTSMVGALGYYATVYYVCRGDVTLATKWNTAMGLAGMGFGFLGLFFFSGLARRKGKRVAMITVFSLAIGGFLATWVLYNPALPALQLLSCGLTAFTGAGFWTLYYSMLADVMDYDELETGKRREGAFMSCQSWITKVGIALGAGASGFILKFTGFDAKLEGAQTEQAILMIRVFLMAIPVVGLVLALAALVRYPLTQARMLELRGALEARRGKV